MKHATLILALQASIVTLSACGTPAVQDAPTIHAGDRITGLPFATRSEVVAQHGMAATSQPLATQAALRVLQDGGNAVDAAIAANAVLALTEPTGSGLGGDLFAIVWWQADHRLYGLNASGRSPRSLTPEVFQAKGLTEIPPYGPLPVSVPGCVDGWFELHDRFGAKPMADDLAPAIGYARDGFPVSELIAHYWQLSVPRLSRYPGFAEQFTIDGHAPAKGEVFRNPNLARTLERLVAGGRDVFYRGAIAHEISDWMAANGGYLSYDDLAAHHSEWVDPVSVRYRGYDVWELPPNGQGIAVLEMLGILEGYDLKSLGFGNPETVHLQVEAKKLAFEDRARFYADMDFADVPVQGLISKAYADSRRERIDPDHALTALEAGNPRLAEGDTVYLTTADSAGNMVSLIQSNFRGMGSGMAPANLGFVLQDRGELFDLTPGRANSYAPGKRPFHTIIPAFVTRDGEPWLSFGVMGGAFQPQGQVQVLCNLIDFGMNLQEAGDAPRWIHQRSSQPTGTPLQEGGGTVSLESGFPPAVEAGLRARGHRIGDVHGLYGGYQAILFDRARGVYYGASESRKDGQAAGY